MSPVQFIKDSRERGFSTAFTDFKNRRHLPVVAYLILAGFTAFAFQQEREHSNQNREQLAQQTRVVLIAGCERQNQLRVTLQGLIASGIPQTKQYVKDGTLTPAQGDRSIAQSKTAIKTLAPVDCTKAYVLGKKATDAQNDGSTATN